MGAVEPPQFPAGNYEAKPRLDGREREEAIAEVAALPGRLREALAGLSDVQLDTKYRNWTVRQIVHHIADSHVNGYARHRLALTEDRPTIKPYDESRWATLEDAVNEPVQTSLAMLDSLHARWARVLRSLTPEQFEREYFHPEQGRHLRLDESVGAYAWHGRHHVAQVEWVRRRWGW